MEQKKNSEVYQYHVTYSPEIENNKMKKRLLNEHREIVGQVIAFDGMVLYTGVKLDKNVSVFTSASTLITIHSLFKNLLTSEYIDVGDRTRKQNSRG